MAQQGIAPLIDLPAMLQQYEQLKQPQTNMPQAPTVRDQISQMAQMKEQGLGAIQAQPSQGVPATNPQAAPPMQQGLGGLNAGAMENPEGFAGGGIVAFDNGGPAASTQPIVAANLPKPRTDQELFQYFSGLRGEGYLPTFKKYEAEDESIEKEQGIGEFAKSIQEERDLLKKQETRSLEELEMDRANLRRQEAADIAGFATKSRSTLEAMAKARSAAVTRERELEKEIRTARNEREKAAINLTKSTEANIEKRNVRTAARVDRDEQRFIDAEKTLNDRQFDREKIAEEYKFRTALAGFEAASRMQLAQFDRGTQIAVTEARARVEAGRGTPTDYALGGALAKAAALREQIANEADPAKKAALQAQLQRAETEVATVTDAINQTKLRTGATPIDVSQAQGGGAPAASDVRSRADAILAGG
jgi:hypothetical protein